jgi:hypothetical protein
VRPVGLSISNRIRRKLAERHNVTEDEVLQCFQNLEGEYLRDTREDNQTEPATYWFIAPTNRERKLKVCFVARRIETPDGAKTVIEIKTAYDPNADEIALYERKGKC